MVGDDDCSDVVIDGGGQFEWSECLHGATEVSTTTILL